MRFQLRNRPAGSPFRRRSVGAGAGGAPVVAHREMRQRVHVAQLAVLHPEQVHVGCAGDAAGAAHQLGAGIAPVGGDGPQFSFDEYSK